jgi:RNAse (barnase) inhibitor barstar
MKTCVLDGATLRDAAAVYRKLGEALGAPGYFGHNPDALWDLLTEHGGEPLEIVWRHSAQSAARLEPAVDQILAVLKRADKEGHVKLKLE